MESPILYVPLDERPCNYRFPQYIAEIGGTGLVLPPKELLGRFKDPADVDALWDWVLEEAGKARYLVLSVDMLCYGGIVPSRLHHLPSDECRKRIDRLRSLRGAFPDAKIYAFQLITRAPARNGSGEEPDYYEEHGYDIFRYGVIADKESMNRADEGELAEKAAILQRVPATALQDFLQRREINFQNNIHLLELAAEGIFDHFVVPLDDCFSYGYAPAERRRLAERAAELHCLSRIAMYPGADEMGCTLVSRALCDRAGIRPAVWVEYSSETGRLTVPAYEDRSIGETVPHHIRCAGGRVAAGPGEADAVLAVNPPTPFSNRVKFELDRRRLYLEPDRDLGGFLEQIEGHLGEGRVCVVADSAVPDGADECLMRFLWERDLLRRITGFSAWNTSSNAVGTAVAHALAHVCAQAAGGSSRKNPISEQFRAMRYLEDWAYMTHVRQDLNDQVAAGAFGVGLDNRYLGDLSETVAAEVERRLQVFARERLGEFHGDFRVSLPWNRLFEIELEWVGRSRGHD